MGFRAEANQPLSQEIATGNSGNVATSTETTMISAPGAGVRYRISKITVSNDNTTTAQRVDVRDGPGGATLYEIVCPAVSAAINAEAKDFNFSPALVLSENKAVVFFTASGAANTRMSCVAYRERI